MRHVVLFCYRHAWYVIAAWLVILVGLTAVSRIAASDYRDSLSLPASDSQSAQQLLSQADGRGSDTELVVVQATHGLVSSATVRARVDPMLRRIAGLPHVSGVVSPYEAPAAGGSARSSRGPRISRDGTVALASVTYGVAPNEVTPAQARALISTADSAASPEVRVAVSGLVAERATPPSLGSAYVGLLAAAVVLLLTFGSLFSMLLPIIAAAVSVGSGIAIIALVSHVMTVAQVSPEIAALMGLGVGIDYSLFLVSRYRQGLMAGQDRERALGEAAVTSGRSVLFAGVTVCVALLGMFTVGISFLYGLAVGSSITVLLTMGAALTLLPALLRLFGPRVLSRRERRRLVAGTLVDEREHRLWHRWAQSIGHRSLLPMLGSLALVGVLAVPFFSMRLGMPDAALDPSHSTTQRAYEMIAKGFGPGFTGPLVVVGHADTAGERRALDTIAVDVRALPGVAGVTPPSLTRTSTGTVATLTVYPTTAPQDQATVNLVHTLRERVVAPATRGEAAAFHVGGTTAVDVDFARAVTDRLPVFIATVIAISLVLLLIVFRSLLIPLTAAVMNILSVATAFGVITATFQWGWLSSLLGVDHTGPIEPYVPVMLFAGLFGLSMDYEVFLISRIQEEWLRRRDNRHAVVHGLAVTGRTITAAAVIMVLVFASFILGGQRVVKEAGLGLSVAVLLDAIVIRSVLVPAVMVLLGRVNWWLPRGLDRLLPTIRVDTQPPPPRHDVPAGSVRSSNAEP